MSYTQTTLIPTRDCDMRGCWKPSAILEAMQEVAIAHCESLGLGRGALEAQGVAWVLSRCHVELSRLPRSMESVSVETYATPKRHLLYRRAHVFRDANGNVFGGAQGYWVLLNLQTRSIESNTLVDERIQVDAADAPVSAPITVRPLHAAPVCGVLTPQYSEYDMNGHVNNARYLDWCCNAIGFEGFMGREMTAFDVNYDSEILPGESIRTELCLNDGNFSFCGYSGDKRRFGVSGQLRPISEAINAV